MAVDGFSGRDFNPPNASTLLSEPLTCPSPAQAMVATSTIPIERKVVTRIERVDFTRRAYLGDSVGAL